MAATTVKSENVTNIEANPITALDRKTGEIKTVIDQDAVATTSIDEASDITLFCPIPSNAVILDVLVLNDDLDSHACPTLEGDWGLYYSGIGGTQYKDGNTSGTVIDANCFEDADTALQAAVTTWNSKRFITDNIVDVKKEAWEVAGLTADPGGIFYVGFTVGTAAATAAAGDVVVRVDYI
jgi:hypothetical protein